PPCRLRVRGAARAQSSCLSCFPPRHRTVLSQLTVKSNHCAPRRKRDTEITARSLLAILALAIERTILLIIENPLAATEHALTPCATAVELHADHLGSLLYFAISHLLSAPACRMARASLARA